MGTIKTVDDYIASFPKERHDILTELRSVIKKELPDNTEETISYGVPTFKLNGKYIIYFAAYKNHISIYPVFDSMEKELKEIATYRTGKGTLQFPLDKPLPYLLIKKITKYMLLENRKRTEGKK